MNDACVAEEIPAAHYIMFGGPDETYDSVREGMQNVERIDKNVVFAFSGIRILPGTELHTRAIEEQVIEAECELLMPAYYFSPQIEVEQMNGMILETFKKNGSGFSRHLKVKNGWKSCADSVSAGCSGILWSLLKGRKPVDKG